MTILSECLALRDKGVKRVRVVCYRQDYVVAICEFDLASAVSGGSFVPAIECVFSEPHDTYEVKEM